MPSATPITPPPPASIALGQRSRITLVSELGRGDKARVHRGVLEGELRRTVAVKIFDLSDCEDPEVAAVSLARAAQRWACILHPNVVSVSDFVRVDGVSCAIVEELVEGEPLSKLIEAHAQAGRRLPLDLALFIATEIAEGLSGAQAATTPDGIATGVAHLDLSSHQVMLSRYGGVKLTDFGLAGAARWTSCVRSIRAITHRASSMAPEIACGRAGDLRSDVFSLGILLREMLVGPRFSLDMTETEALGYAREGHVPPTFTELQLPSDVRAILARAVDRDPSRRFPHATAMAYELRRVALSMGVGDARIFLRAAVAGLSAASEPDTITPPAPLPRLADDDGEEPTAELDLADIVPSTIPPDRSSGVIERVERRTSGTDE